MSDAKRGGARPGAGRPKGETTTMVRVPDGCLEQVRQLISVYRKCGDLTVTAVAVPAASQVVQGDVHKQVALPLPEPKPQLPDPGLSTAEQAWAVYMPLLSQYKVYGQFKKRFLKFADYDGGYSYLFMLQLLERLAKMSEGLDHVPYEWTSTIALREFARKLYKANPQWH